MSHDQPEPGSVRVPTGDTAGGGEDTGASRWRSWSVVLPALAFLAGLLLGGAVIGAAFNSDNADSSAAGGPGDTATPTTTPTATASDLNVTVPGPCVQAAERADDAYALVERGVKAARDLDAGALADLVDEVQRQRPEVQALIAECQQQTGDRIVNPGPTPTVTTTP